MTAAALLLAALTAAGSFLLLRPETDSAALAPLTVHFIDVGQGDATLLICDGHAMVIDAGTQSSGTLLRRYLAEQDVTTLDYAVGTHPDADHIGALDVLLYHLPCDLVLMPDLERDTSAYRDVIDTIAFCRLTLSHPSPGETYALADASFTVLGPIDGTAAESNNHSICLMVEHGDNRFLFTGDAEKEEEEDLLSSGCALGADVYQLGHHGSSTSTSDAFLEAVSPTWAVVSAGAGNRYGHPHRETLEKLKAAEVSLFRTDLQGTIVATSDGSSILWSCSPSEDWRSGSEMEETALTIYGKNLSFYVNEIDNSSSQ